MGGWWSRAMLWHKPDCQVVHLYTHTLKTDWIAAVSTDLNTIMPYSIKLKQFYAI